MSALFLSACMQTIPHLSKDLPIPSEFLDKFELAQFVLLQHFASCRCSVVSFQEHSFGYCLEYIEVLAVGCCKRLIRTVISAVELYQQVITLLSAAAEVVHSAQSVNCYAFQSSGSISESLEQRISTKHCRKSRYRAGQSDTVCLKILNDIMD